MAATSNYVTIVNNAVQESGADLASFDVSGSDWSSNTNAMLNRFKTWVARAWKQIQIDNYDWEFMEEQGLCNLDPGIMFYTDSTTTLVTDASTALANSTITIYDQDGTTALTIPVSTFTDLTNSVTGYPNAPFGYFNISGANLATPLNIALKPAAEWFYIPKNITFDNSASYTSGIISGLVNNTSRYPITLSGSHPLKANVVISGTTYTIGLTGISSSSIGYFFNTADTAALAALTAGGPITLIDPITGDTIVSYTSVSGLFGVIGPGTYTASYLNAGRGYVHSWKSFDFNEEIQPGDFQTSIQEIDPGSFRLIDYYKGAPTGEVPLPYVPWNTFRSQYDLSSAYPGLPRIITEDADGRYRLYPAPYYRVSIKFDYDRQPQILSSYNDIPHGLDEDFVDLIMWRALIAYGEYDEQPSVVARATKNYKTMLSRLELRNREKFHFRPKRLY